MGHTRRQLLGAVAASAALAGCLAGDGTETATDGNGGGSPTGDATVQVRDHGDLGEILVGPDGMTLYMFDSDTEGSGASSCSGGCAENWPPLTVDGDATAGDGVTASLSTFDREDGSTQVAAAGWPLYYFAPDESPGDATGQGVQDVWWVLGPDGTPKRPDASPTPTDSMSGSGGDDTPTDDGNDTPTDDGYDDGYPA